MLEASIASEVKLNQHVIKPKNYVSFVYSEDKQACSVMGR